MFNCDYNWTVVFRAMNHMLWICKQVVFRPLPRLEQRTPVNHIHPEIAVLPEQCTCQVADPEHRSGGNICPFVQIQIKVPCSRLLPIEIHPLVCQHYVACLVVSNIFVAVGQHNRVVWGVSAEMEAQPKLNLYGRREGPDSFGSFQRRPFTTTEYMSLPFARLCHSCDSSSIALKLNTEPQHCIAVFKMNHSVPGLVGFVIAIMFISTISIVLRFWSRFVATGLSLGWVLPPKLYPLLNILNRLIT